MKRSNTAAPVVSVVVPVYNRRDLAVRCVRSLLLQEFSKNYEIVVVDDGSTDGSAEAVASIHSDVRVVRQPNLGAASARQTGIQAARADIVAFQDSDDVATSAKLAVLYEALATHPSCVMACAAAQDTEGRIQRVPQGVPAQMDGRCTIIDNPLEVLLCQGYPIASAMNLMTYRRCAMEWNHNRRRFPAANDYDLELQLARCGPVVFVACSTVVYEFQTAGLTLAHGSAYQAAFALCAARDAMRSIDNRGAYGNALRKSTDKLAAPALVETLARREWGMFAEILGISLRYGGWWSLPRRLWWALDTMSEDRPEKMPSVIRYCTRKLARFRDVVSASTTRSRS